MDSKLDLHSAKDLREVLARASSFLSQANQETYIAQWLLRERFDISHLDLTLNDKDLTQEQLLLLEKDLIAVAKDYPPQYQVGHTWFYGRKFWVNEDVLIPRPETEEMLDTILKHHSKEGIKVLDIGTGSGVIALSLKAERPSWRVWASDLSQAALNLAQKNAKSLDLDVQFIQGDLTQPVKKEKFDLLVSNPPYIAPSEWNEMGASVRKYEPKLALFADRDGLDIYYRLAEELPPIMEEEGDIYLEIGYKQGQIVKAIMQEAFNLAALTIYQDLAGQDRYLHIQL